MEMKSTRRELVSKAGPKAVAFKKVPSDASEPMLGAEPVADEQISLFPWSAAVCCVLSAISLLAILAVPRALTSAKPSIPILDLNWHARVAMLLIIQSMVLEVFILIASYTAVGIATDDLRPEGGSMLRQPARKQGNGGVAKRVDLAQHNLCDSLIVIGEYLLKFFTALHFMSAEGIVSYATPLSPDPDRTVFPVRHLQWAFAVPLLVLLSNRTFLAGHCSDSQVMQRSAPALILSGMYCITSLAMEVTTSPLARNLLMALVLVNFLAVCVDQVVVARQVPTATSKGAKVCMLGFQLFTFLVYALLYFFAYFGFVTVIQEQSLYTYMDASIKVLHGCFLAMLRNREDIRVIRLWWLESVAARKDFERLVEQARVPIFGMDLMGRVTSWNGSMAQITGLAAEAVEGEPLLRLVHQDCHKIFTEAQASAAAAAHNSCNAMELLFRKNPWAGEDGASGASGGKSNCAVLVVSLVKQLSRQGAVEGYVGIGQDITQLCDMKAVEQKKTQLMAVVSHELRSPLHGMIGLTTAMEGAVPDKVKRQVGMVRSCANRLLDLVTNIMDITESEQKQRKGLGARDKKSIVNLLDVAEEVTVMTMMAVDKAGKPLVSEGVELRNLMPELEKFPIVLGNPYKLTQLFYNLMTNACKFTKKGSVTLRAVHRKDTSTLELSVEDTGAGISKDSLERIFKPFEQDHGSTADARSFQGMGLGLAVCKEAVRLHQGSISVASQQGKGSTFTVSLPCQDTFVERKGPSVSKALADDRAKALARLGGTTSATSSSAPASQGTMRAKSKEAAAAEDMGLKIPTTGSLSSPEEDRRPMVLSVDDDEVNQEVVRNALSHDCDIHSSMDGMQALEFLEGCTKAGKQMPDVILLDIQMPGLTGYDVLAEVRKKYSREHTKLPVIMASAKTPVEHTAMKSYAGGCTDFLPKPFHTDVLRAKIMVALEIKKELLQDSRSAAASRDTAAKASTAAAQAEASRWESAAKACQEKLDEAQQRADQAVQKEASALRQVADAEAQARAEADRARRAESELAEMRQELQRARLGAPALPSPPPSEGRAEKAESELAELRQELQRMRLAAAASPPAASETARTAASSQVPLSPGPPISQLGYAMPQSPTVIPAPICPTRAPSLYARLADCEQEIMELRGRLATEASARQLAARQLDTVIQAAAHSKGIMGLAQ